MYPEHRVAARSDSTKSDIYHVVKIKLSLAQNVWHKCVAQMRHFDPLLVAANASSWPVEALDNTVFVSQINFNLYYHFHSRSHEQFISTIHHILMSNGSSWPFDGRGGGGGAIWGTSAALTDPAGLSYSGGFSGWLTYSASPLRGPAERGIDNTLKHASPYI